MRGGRLPPLGREEAGKRGLDVSMVLFAGLQHRREEHIILEVV